MCPNAFKVFGFGNFFVQGVWASVLSLQGGKRWHDLFISNCLLQQELGASLLPFNVVVNICVLGLNYANCLVEDGCSL